LTREPIVDRITLLDPTEGAHAPVVREADRLDDLRGIRLGLVDNGKYRVGPLLAGLAAELERRHGAQVSVRIKKPAAGRSLTAGDLERLKREADAVVNGVGD
jgi:hypothetical protein